MKPINERIALIKNLCSLVRELELDISYLAVRYTGDCSEVNGTWFYSLRESMTAEFFYKNVISLAAAERRLVADEITFSRFERNVTLPDWCNNYPILGTAASGGWGNVSVLFDAVLWDLLPEDPFADAGSEGTMLFSIKEQTMQHYHVKTVLKEEIQHIFYEVATLRPVTSKSTKSLTKPIRKVKS